MFFRNSIENIKAKKIKIFVDMDGVIADYVVGEAKNYDKKRPLHTVIDQLKEISSFDNVELFILSISKMDIGVNEKNLWLDVNAPFFKKENRVIISRESNNMEKSHKLKCDYIRNVKREQDCKIVVIDDDCDIVHKLKEQNDDIIVLKDTVFFD